MARRMTRKQAFDAQVNHYIVVVEERIKEYIAQGMTREQALMKSYHELQAERNAAR